MRLPDIMRHSGRALGLSTAQITRRSSARATAYPRQVVMTMCRHYSDHSLPQIGQSFGGMHHTSVLHGLRAVENRCGADPDYFRAVAVICALLESELLYRLKIQQQDAPAMRGVLAPPWPTLPAIPHPSATPCPARRIMVPA